MIDIALSKIVLIGAVALIVVGPDRMPKLARTVGTLLGKAQRYVADVKAEVNRSMDLEELKKMRDTMQDAANEVQSAVTTTADDFEKTWAEATGEALSGSDNSYLTSASSYQVPKKRWRAKVGAVPNWYKARHGTKRHVLSGAARVARYRPTKSH